MRKTCITAGSRAGDPRPTLTRAVDNVPVRAVLRDSIDREKAREYIPAGDAGGKHFGSWSATSARNPTAPERGETLLNLDFPFGAGHVRPDEVVPRDERGQLIFAHFLCSFRTLREDQVA